MAYSPARTGDVVLIIIPHYWGKGPTYTAAARQVKKAGGTIRVNEQHVYSVHPDTVCTEPCGDMRHPKGHPPIRLNT